LKLVKLDKILNFHASPPARGAWIETCWVFRSLRRATSPPARGAWIETPCHLYNTSITLVAPRAGGVD
jgi:hypothetical protein